MIDGSEKRNRQLAFELQNSHVCEKRSYCNKSFLSEVYTPEPVSVTAKATYV